MEAGCAAARHADLSRTLAANYSSQRAARRATIHVACRSTTAGPYTLDSHTLRPRSRHVNVRTCPQNASATSVRAFTDTSTYVRHVCDVLCYTQDGRFNTGSGGGAWWVRVMVRVLRHVDMYSCTLDADVCRTVAESSVDDAQVLHRRAPYTLYSRVSPAVDPKWTRPHLHWPESPNSMNRPANRHIMTSAHVCLLLHTRLSPRASASPHHREHPLGWRMCQGGAR